MGKPFLVVYYTYEKIFIAQGIYDGLQENEATHNQYSFQEIYDVIGICILCFCWLDFKRRSCFWISLL